MELLDKEDLRIQKARYSHLEFMAQTWQSPSEPFTIGIHTKEMCRLIDESMERLRQPNPQSTFLIVKMPFRHGKSHIISRYLPPHFLGEFPDKEVMVVTYASSLAESFSRYSRTLMKSYEYNKIYPEIQLSKTNGGVQNWGIEGHLGSCSASGLTSGLTGRGASLLILDDFCAGRQDAESEVMRNSMWEHFTNDFLTRRSPASIVIVLATPWHVDDIIGRIEQKIDPNNEHYDVNFPPFKVVSFPAKNGEVDIGVKDFKKYGDRKLHYEHIKYDYLFPERYNEEWYKQQFASLGDYASAGLLQCNPTQRGGNLLKLDKIKFHDTLDDFPKVKFGRFWDLAHTAKQTQKSDPDWTSGTLLTYTKNKDGLWELWIKDVQHYRLSSPERDNMIRATTDKDGMSVPVVVEESLDAKDTVYALQTALMGRRKVQGIKIKHGDKVSRMSYVEPIFEAGNVHILRAGWNLDWLNEARSFPSGKHDDMMDNITAGYEFFCEGNGQVVVAGVLGF